MARRKLLSHMLILTLSGIIAKTLDFSFRAYYSAKLGEEGMGIFSLIMSVFGIVLNLSSAGMGAAVSRLIAIKLGQGDFGAIQKIMSTAIKMVASVGALCCIGIIFGVNKISLLFLKDIRCARGLIYITPSAIFMGISYCIKGYFYAQRRVIIPASSEFVEQAVKISLISLLLNKWLPYGIEMGVSAVFLGLTIGEMCSCAYLCFWYIKEIPTKPSKESQFMAIFSQTLPMSLSAVGCSYLRMQEDIWIVRGFRKFGMNNETALEAYGLIHGMAMPLLVFPLTLLSSFMALLVPEISIAKERGRLCETVSLVYKTAWIFGCVIFCIFFVFAEEISYAVYGSFSAAEYVRPLCLLCPFMIIDSISTGMLSGLGEQAKLFKYSIMDSLLRLGLVYFLLPIGGNKIIILMIFASNILTFCLTVRRIKTLSNMDWNLLKTILPVTAVTGAVAFLSLV